MSTEVSNTATSVDVKALATTASAYLKFMRPSSKGIGVLYLSIPKIKTKEGTVIAIKWTEDEVSSFSNFNEDLASVGEIEASAHIFRTGNDFKTNEPVLYAKPKALVYNSNRAN